MLRVALEACQSPCAIFYFILFSLTLPPHIWAHLHFSLCNVTQASYSTSVNRYNKNNPHQFPSLHQLPSHIHIWSNFTIVANLIKCISARQLACPPLRLSPPHPYTMSILLFVIFQIYELQRFHGKVSTPVLRVKRGKLLAGKLGHFMIWIVWWKRVCIFYIYRAMSVYGNCLLYTVGFEKELY